MTEAGTAYPSRGRAWWLVAILFSASIVSVLDRGILDLVVDPVRADLALSDVQISLLQGLAFGIFYATVGLPLGLMADRHSRRGLVIAGIVVWSLATLAAGFAQSFGSLFAARILVGLGEAALSPAAISLIADLFPANERGFPISVFLTGQALAKGVAISITSFLTAAAAAGRFAAVPLLRDLAPWRIAFVFCGLLGFAVVAALLTTHEPPRRRSETPGDVAGQAPSSLRYLVANRRVFVPLYLGFAICFLAYYGAGNWAPTMLMRGFGATRVEIGALLGPLTIVFSLIGPTIGGLLVDRSMRRGDSHARLRMLIIAPLCVIPSALAVFAPSLVPAIVLVASSSFFVAVIGTTMLACLQSMVPPNMRGFAVSLTGLVNTLLGGTFGTLLISALTEHFYRNPALVGLSIVSVVLPSVVCGSLLFALAARNLRRQEPGVGSVRSAMSPLEPQS